jgi:D-threonate/D-erythronate kinase
MNSEDRILVLADDLTGALEVGAKFGRRGIATKVTTEMNLLACGRDARIQVMVIDAETRHLPPSEAAARVSTLARSAHRSGFSHVYKKTDSTLRGNIASELAALLKAWPGSGLIYVPAYPRMGRTVTRGTLYVHGVPVGETEFGDDELNPVRGSHIPTLIGSQCSVPVFSIGYDAVDRTDSPAIYVCDAETDERIAQAAAAFARSDKLHLAAGPAAFAGSLAEHLTASQASPTLPRNLRNGLVVSGSRNKVSAGQLQHAAHTGFTVAGPAEIPSILAEGGWAILKLADRSPETALDFAARAGQTVCELLAYQQPDVLIVFGGDTAYSIIRALGQPSLRPLGEVMEGIPLSIIEAGAGSDSAGLHLITKAGGFGSPDVLVSIRKIVSGE